MCLFNKKMKYKKGCEKMAQIKKTNTICRNCGKKYYSCYHCLKKQNWRTVCCNETCYNEYVQKILETRGQTIEISKRMDMTDNEVKDFIANVSEETAIEKTKEELSDYIEENPDMNINDIVKKVNEDIDNSNKKRKK